MARNLLARFSFLLVLTLPLVGLGCIGEVPQIDTPALQFPTNFLPTPVPEAQVVMTNSKGEVLQQGKTDATGQLQGERGPGQTDQIIYVDATLADGTKIRRVVKIPEGYRITSLRVFVDRDDYAAQYEPATPRNKTEGGGDGGGGD